MNLTLVQLQALKADIAVGFPGQPNTSDANDAIAKAYNLVAAPDFWVWRTSVFESEYTRSTSEDATTWSWTAFIARSLQEQNAWARMFMGGQSGANPSLANVRQGIADIFSGNTNNAPAQRTHLLAISRRRATRFEKVFAVGTGSAASPAVMALEGTVSYQDIENARNS